MQSTMTKCVLECMKEIFSRHRHPISLKSDNGLQFISKAFADFCRENSSRHCRVNVKWAEANGEVERQNRSMLKHLQITQAEENKWRRELRKYLLQYQVLPHSTMGWSPTELLYNRQIRTKMQGAVTGSQPLDQEIRDLNSESKALSKNYIDQRGGARDSDVEVGDRVLVEQDRQHKLTTPYQPMPCNVTAKSWNSLIVQSPGGAEYNQNSTQVRK